MSPLFGVWILTVPFFITPMNAQGLPGKIVYSVPGMDKVETRPNLVYRKDGSDEMKMDIYMPPKLAGNESRPVVLFIHGGPLGPKPSPGAKDRPFFQSYGRLVAASGLVGVTLDHRYVSSKSKDMEVSFSDVEAAIRFIRSNASSYHIDPDRIAIWAFSGGGPHISIGLRRDTPYIRCLPESSRPAANRKSSQTVAGFPSEITCFTSLRITLKNNGHGNWLIKMQS